MTNRKWLTVAVLGVGLGCGPDTGGTGGAGGQADGSGGHPNGEGGRGGGSTLGGGAVGGSAGAGGAELPTSEVHLVGRYQADSGEATWSGSSARATMTGPDVSVRLNGSSGIWFEAVVDGEAVGRFETSGGEELFQIATGLAPGEHIIEIIRRNEGFFGKTAFVGFEPTEAIVPTVWPYAHRLEFIGDSLTCGYGIEGSSASCNFSGATESAYSTYAMVAARELGAAAHLICYSGKGVHQNYGGNLDEPMPVLYPRTFTGDPSIAWDPADFPADAVVINLGTNDFSAPIDGAAFVSDYVSLLQTVRARHPSAYLLGVTWAHWGASKEALVEQAFDSLGDPNSGTLGFSIDPADGLGCDYHTNTVTNGKLGMLLRDTLSARLGW